jgi:hypothetical protein
MRAVERQSMPRPKKQLASIATESTVVYGIAGYSQTIATVIQRHPRIDGQTRHCRTPIHHDIVRTH